MGLKTAELVAFMSNELGWTLTLSNGGNLGKAGGIREVQIKFSAPNPINLITPHLLVEMRSLGYVEMNWAAGSPAEAAGQQLSNWLSSSWRSVSQWDWGGSEPFCSLKLNIGRNVNLKFRGTQGENNMGQKTSQLANAMASEILTGWEMVTCDSGNVGSTGSIREQQMIFRQRASNHITSATTLIVEFRQIGYVEISGPDTGGIYADIGDFLQNNWGCKTWDWGSKEPFCDLKFEGHPFCRRGGQGENNMGMLGIEFIDFMQQRGWSLLILNGGGLGKTGQIREMQLKFQSPDPARPPKPILFVELRQIGYVEICGADTAGVYQHLHTFLTQYLHCTPYQGEKLCAVKYHCPSFKRRGQQGENNMGMLTMRLCDFLTDHIGGWDLVACTSNNLGETGTIREQLCAFRHIGDARRPLPSLGGGDLSIEGSVEGISFPESWTLINRDDVLSGPVQQIGRASVAECELLQEFLDKTFQAKKTRDRVGELPERLQLVSAVVSEHLELYRRYHEARSAVLAALAGGPMEEAWQPRTRTSKISQQGGLSQVEAYLFHGTNPASALSILRKGFSVDLSGASVGMMFGAGVYLAEKSSKSDEYAKGDELNPDICALLVCRVVVGRCFVTTEPGDHAKHMSSGEVETVLGDREAAVGTYREFIAGSGDRVYPEFCVLYQRVFAQGVAPGAAYVADLVRE